MPASPVPTPPSPTKGIVNTSLRFGASDHEAAEAHHRATGESLNRFYVAAAADLVQLVDAAAGDAGLLNALKLTFPPLPAVQANTSLRLPYALHEAVVRAADRLGVSKNRFLGAAVALRVQALTPATPAAAGVDLDRELTEGAGYYKRQAHERRRWAAAVAAARRPAGGRGSRHPGPPTPLVGKGTTFTVEANTWLREDALAAGLSQVEYLEALVRHAHAAREEDALEHEAGVLEQEAFEAGLAGYGVSANPERTGV